LVGVPGNAPGLGTHLVLKQARLKSEPAGD
jgi:hypothetical protein